MADRTAWVHSSAPLNFASSNFNPPQTRRRVEPAGTSSLALAQYAPSNPVSGAAAGAAGGAASGAATGGAVAGPVGAAVGGAVGTATGAATGTVAGTANMFAAPFGVSPGGRMYGSSLPPGEGGCPAGQMNYKGYCYPNQPAMFTK